MTIVTNQYLNQDVIVIPKLAENALYPPLDTEVRTAIPTNAAAYYLNRKSQTLRAWACFENGPINPVRINGRLAWKVADIKTLIEGGK